MRQEKNFLIAEDEDFKKAIDLTFINKNQLPSLILEGENVETHDGLRVLISHGVIIKRIENMAKELLEKLDNKKEFNAVVVKEEGLPFYERLIGYVRQLSPEIRINTSYVDPKVYNPKLPLSKNKNGFEMHFEVPNKEIVVLNSSANTLNTGIRIKGALRKMQADRVLFWALVSKPASHVHPEFVLDNAGFKLPSIYVLGWGMDKDGHYRNLRNISYSLVMNK